MHYWIIFVSIYLGMLVFFLTVDWLYSRSKKRRQAKILAKRLSLLREFAEGKRVA
jgi:hypothetical protein